jgi:predicted TIM-barrel fold metal-dependent hydrolase
MYCNTKAFGMHLDDPRLDPLLEKCAELKLPVNIHVAEPIWMYQKMDSTNDGLMNAYNWRLDNQPEIVNHDGMIDILENAVKRHPNTIFIACHFANCSYDLNKLGGLLDKYSNLYADIAARYAETSTIPRFTSKFIEKYQDRLVYGTDMGIKKEMYQITFRILESADEHFYELEQFGYHWNLYGLDLDDAVLEKLYNINAEKLVR